MHATTTAALLHLIHQSPLHTLHHDGSPSLHTHTQSRCSVRARRRAHMIMLRVCGLVLVQLAALVLLAQDIFGSVRPDSAVGSPSTQALRLDDPPALFTRTILIVIDGLRSDMVFLRPEMEHLRSLLSSGRAVGYVARAHSPTVTMPRIKALVTGTVPRFADLFRNLASGSQEHNEDSLVARWRRANKTLVLHGDDTWLKLFPTAFDSTSDGTSSSFFTPDFVQVDLNVTRHLPEELDPRDKHAKSRGWDVLVLHYLGVDHIGHQHGPASPRMAAKLVEMDGVVRTVVHAARSQDELRPGQRTLVALLSDHGMSASGNHGGNSPDETAAVAVFFAPSCDECSYAAGGGALSALQVDVAPTLGLLLGLGVPEESVGVVMRGALQFCNANVTAVERANAAQLRRACERWSVLPVAAEAATLEAMQEALLRALTAESSDDDDDSAWTALALLGLGLPALVHSADARASPAVVAAVAAQALSLFSSSAVENEHAVLLSMAALGLLHLARRHRSRAAVFALIALRALRSRCQIINFARLAGLPEPVFAVQGTALLADSEPWPLLAAPLMALLALRRGGGGGRASWLAVVVRQSWFADSAWAARAALLVVAGETAAVTRDAVDALLAVLCLLHRRDVRLVLASASILAARAAAAAMAADSRRAEGDAALLVLLVGEAVSFGLGQTMHSVASIDIAPGYTFSTSFNRELVAALTLLVTFSGPALAVVALRGQGASTVRAAVSFRLFVAGAVAVAMRQHLFVWSVFAPRLAFEAGLFLVVSVAQLVNMAF